MKYGLDKTNYLEKRVQAVCRQALNLTGKHFLFWFPQLQTYHAENLKLNCELGLY